MQQREYENIAHPGYDINFISFYRGKWLLAIKPLSFANGANYIAVLSAHSNAIMPSEWCVILHLCHGDKNHNDVPKIDHKCQNNGLQTIFDKCLIILSHFQGTNDLEKHKNVHESIQIRNGTQKSSIDTKKLENL